MPTERENIKQNNLIQRQYKVAQQDFRAFYDADENLVFVLDYYVDDKKPNVLLVMNPKGDRKWDDVLENDWGVDLEDVRPKRNNKYQKLDIEYSGLELYENLFDAIDDDADYTEQLRLVDMFRQIAVRRSAEERLKIAEVTADNARETIEKTHETIDNLRDKLKELRGKHAEYKKNIGKEPTKQSAAKILRTESQIDAVNDKLARANKRLDNAQKRLLQAEDDADVARKILEMDTEDAGFVAMAKPDAFVPVVFDEAPAPAVVEEEKITEFDEPTIEQKAEDMADEEVKPLFDTDPNILDEEIAFQPIQFDVPEVPAPVQPIPVPEPVAEVPVYQAPVVEPVSFVPPADVTPMPVPEPVAVPNVATDYQGTTPVLNSIKSVDEPKPMPVSDPAPIDSGFRPVSPITGEAVSQPQDAGIPARTGKPSAVTYLLLVVLIALSIFTLWFYRKSSGDKLPDLGAVTQPEVVAEDTQKPTEEQQKPVVEEEPSVPTIEVPPVVVEPEPEVVQVKPEIVVPLEETVVVEPADTIEPIVADVEEQEVEVETPFVEPVVNKPAYNVSQNENMFVADENFVTDRVAPVADEQEEYVLTEAEILATKAPVETGGATVVQTVEDDYYVETEAEPEYDPYQPVVVQEEVVEQVSEDLEDDVVEQEVAECSNGQSPDRFGCCPGEKYTAIENGGYACCPTEGGDCFPPMF